MAGKNKDRATILDKLGIKELNLMQQEAFEAISQHSEVVLLSPTGTGKTLAFLLPILEKLNPELEEIQALIIVPSRELAIQIEQVTREMGSGYKVNAVYGGRSGSKDKIELKHSPMILIGTPGRVADHLRNENISADYVKTLVLDEFDKSLEVGFSNEMMEIISALPALENKILTSATQRVIIPPFVNLSYPKQLNYLGEQANSQLAQRLVIANTADKLDTLVQLLHHIGRKNGILFCNLKDSIQQVSDHLLDHNIEHACFYGGLEQIDRERALIKFRNGTCRLLVATDLAARGIDVAELDFIIHFELPFKETEFIHRNGRTARMNSEGTAYILKGERERLSPFIGKPDILSPESIDEDLSSQWETLFISGGRKDKISKGDIAGLFLKQGNLDKNELGMIELKQDCAFVAVPRRKAGQLIGQLNNSRLKKKKVRISLLN